MGDMEGALRGAMADEVADVSLPAGFAGQVRARHRRHRRIRVSATLASVVALVVAVPLATTTVLRDTAGPPPADAPAVDEVDGVVVTYLPDGLVRDPVDGFDYGGPSFADRQGDGWTDRLIEGTGLSDVRWTARTARWHPDRPDNHRVFGYQHGVRVTVFRGDGVEDLPALAESIPGNRTAEPEELDGRLVFRSDIVFAGEWIDVLWPVADGVTLRVRVSDDLEDELERVLDGLDVTGPGEGFLIDAAQEAPPGDGGFCTPASNRPLTSAGQVLGDEWDHFGGVTVGQLPAGLLGGFDHAMPVSGLNDFGGPTVDHGAPDHWQYAYVYRFADTDEEALRVTVACGSDFPRDAEQLGLFLQLRWSGEPQPHQLAGGRPAYVSDRHEDLPGRQLGWLERPGVALEVSVSEELVGQLDEIVDSIQLREPDAAAEDAAAEDAAAACPLPEVRPAALPWLAEGEPLPEPAPLPFLYADEPGAGLVWASDPDREWFDVPYVSISRVQEPDREPGVQFDPTYEVRGHPAEAVWVGDPGNSPIHVSWREQPGQCGVYRLSVNSRGVAPMLGEQWAEGGRCEAGEDPVDEDCFEEFQQAFHSELLRILDSLAS
jgi:hypothetical protein